MKRIVVVIAGLLATTAAAQPQGSPCAVWRHAGLAEGPIGVGYYEADVATGRRVCPRTEVALGTRAGAVIDTPDFYGAIGASGLLSASHALSDRREVFATLEFLQYDWVTNAVIVQSRMGMGQLTAGVSQIVANGDRWATATTARVMLPTSTTINVRVIGGEVGQGLTYRLSEGLELHGFAGLDVTAAVFAPSAQPRLGALVNAGVQYSPASWFGLVLDVNGRAGGYTSYVAPALGLRFRPFKNFGAELAATLPVTGSDRHDALVGLRLGYRL